MKVSLTHFASISALILTTRYVGVVHSSLGQGAGTDNSKGAAYNASADRRSHQAMVDFFKEIFPK